MADDRKPVSIVDSVVRRWSLDLMDALLFDHTTRKNITWADDEYCQLGDGYQPYDEVKLQAITGTRSEVIKTRIMKDAEQQAGRVKRKAEVFTPSWLCNQMNDMLDDQWFGRSGAFNMQTEGGWRACKSKIEFGDARNRSWADYVDCRKLEITCGEAPFLCSRYDTTTGKPIPVKDRIGILDRKLRVVSENTGAYEEWLEWAYRALESTYGYEYQGDNLIVARINMLMTFAEHMHERWGKTPDEAEAAKAAFVIAWNIWQMDGLKGCVPNERRVLDSGDGGLRTGARGLEGPWVEGDANRRKKKGQNQEGTGLTEACTIYDWRAREQREYAYSRDCATSMVKFSGVIGNPPYQMAQQGDNKQYATPIYHRFIEESQKVGDVVVLVHPARFLFRAGRTPKAWNEKMLADGHLKVAAYEEDSSRMFGPSVEIKGGVAVTCWDRANDFGPIGTFTPYDELNGILSKAGPRNEAESLASIVFIQNRFRLDVLLREHAEFKLGIGSNGKDNRLEKNIFLKVPVFTEERENSDDIKVLGILENRRTWRYVPARFIDQNHENLARYKVMIPVASGKGALGEALSTPVIGGPHVAYTRSFIGVGSFRTREGAENCLRYIQTKFARIMLGILKATQMNNKSVWSKVPLQDFTARSDIDWSCPIAEIDDQLFEKYCLTKDEREFISAHAQEMG